MTELLRELEAVVGLLETKAMLSREGEGCAADSYLRRYEYAAAEYIRTHHAEIAEAVSNSVPVSQLVELLPGTYYMDPPDGGDVSVMEQLRRMAKDARRYRWMRNDQTGQAEESVLVDRYGDVEVKIGGDLDAAIDAHNSAREVGE